MKIVAFNTIDEMILARIEGLKTLLEKSDNDYIYELLDMIRWYLSIYESSEHLNDCEICVAQAYYHYINYAMANNLPLPLIDKE